MSLWKYQYSSVNSKTLAPWGVWHQIGLVTCCYTAQGPKAIFIIFQWSTQLKGNPNGENTSEIAQAVLKVSIAQSVLKVSIAPAVLNLAPCGIMATTGLITCCYTAQGAKVIFNFNDCWQLKGNPIVKIPVSMSKHWLLEDMATNRINCLLLHCPRSQGNLLFLPLGSLPM